MAYMRYSIYAFARKNVGAEKLESLSLKNGGRAYSFIKVYATTACTLFYRSVIQLLWISPRVLSKFVRIRPSYPV